MGLFVSLDSSCPTATKQNLKDDTCDVIMGCSTMNPNQGVMTDDDPFPNLCLFQVFAPCQHSQTEFLHFSVILSWL